jgi:divalent metal cation (Fe/Co/Zn/Cd) transporter
MLRRRARRLEYATILWNVGEAGLTIGLGIAAGSLALIGFGADSLIEVFASAVVVWHLRPHAETDAENRTRVALRLVATAFLALAVVLSVFAVRDLVVGREAGESLAGIAYLAPTAIVMFGLAAAKRRTAAALRSAPLRSEAAMTQLDGVLAVLTLTGLALNAAAGWAWADPLAALIVAGAALNEARENWQESTDFAMKS